MVQEVFGEKVKKEIFETGTGATSGAKAYDPLAIIKSGAPATADELIENSLKDQPSKVDLPPFYLQNTGGMYGSYKDSLTQQQTSITVDFLDSIAEETQFFRVIDMIVSDIVRDGFRVSTGDDKADALIKDLNRRWGILGFMDSCRDMLNYGTSFDFIQWAKDEKTILGIKPLNIRTILPMYDNNELSTYNYAGGKATLLPLDILKLTHAAKKGIDFGMPLLMPAAATLTLLLNSSRDIAILIDRYAVPIVHWLLDSGVGNELAKKKVSQEQIEAFAKTLIPQKTGEDLITDISAKAEILGVQGSVWNFDQSLEFLNQQFYAICGVPSALLGFGGDNLSVTTRQLSTYYGSINGLRMRMGQQMVDQLYKPYLAVNGKPDLDIEIQFPFLEIEERSLRIQWVRPMYQDGAIPLEEYRTLMDLKPTRPADKQQATIPANLVGQALNQTYTNPRQTKPDDSMAPPEVQKPPSTSTAELSVNK